VSAPWLGALETGTRPAERSIHDPGFYTLPGQAHQYRCWKTEGHGAVDLHRSVVVSCDTYYYGLAVEMGIEKMHDFLARFNLGKPSGIDIEGERSGLNPNEAWKRARFKDKWYTGDTVSAGIGQGYMLATPMQLAYAVSVMANRVVAYRPHLAKEIFDEQTGKTRRIEPKPAYQTRFGDANLDRVREAMVGVTQPGGTAAQAALGLEGDLLGQPRLVDRDAIGGEGRDDRGVATSELDHGGRCYRAAAIAAFISATAARNPMKTARDTMA
jgi:penicillin-binding protein 2